MSGGIDPRVQPIPVAPACHYHMGGIATDADGRSSLPGLYASGECASTGVHGANRLASNSLLEAAVFGARAGRAAALETPVSTSLEPVMTADLPASALQTLRRAMSRDAGVIRSAEGLTRLLDAIGTMDVVHGPSAPLIAARLVAASALARRESRGGHYRSDFKKSGDALRTFVTWDQIEPSSLKLAAE